MKYNQTEAENEAKIMSYEQKQEAAERGAEWGRQEAELQLEAVANGHRRKAATWATGHWSGDNPFPTDDDRCWEYDSAIDRAAQAAYEAAVEAAQPSAAPMIAAIKAGIAAGGDEQGWDAPEFAEARRLTDIGMQWDFDGWGYALTCLEAGKLGGVEVRA
jgi:hypothetical protein